MPKLFRTFIKYSDNCNHSPRTVPQNDQDRGSNYKLVISQDTIYYKKDIFNVKKSKPSQLFEIC